MKKKRKAWSHDSYLKAAIRRIWRWSDKRKSCLSVKRCGLCNKEGPLFADHVDPVVDPKRGFQDWNTYIDRMFMGPLQALCKTCHDKKTLDENKLRRRTRAQARTRASN